MSLMKTLAKVAIGIAVAKGVKKMTSGSGNRDQQSGGGLGSILGQLSKAAGGGQSGGGLGSILGQLSQGGASQSGGGLGSILGSLAGAAAGGGSSNSGLGGMLGGLLGGAQQQGSQSGGGLGDLLNSLTQGQGGGGLGDMLNQSLDSFGEPQTQPTAEQDQAAGVLLSAMLQAAKADGQIDAEEKAAITEHLGDATEEEIAFINQQLDAPVDPQGLARSVPSGMEQQAYAMSLLAIDLDNKNEANYLHSFASALQLDANTVNSIHSQMDEPALYNS